MTEDMASNLKVVFIGTGGMGTGVAHNLLKAGYDLTVCNRTKAKAHSLIEAGAVFARTPSDAAADADVIISMVGDNQDSREVWLGPDGVLAGQFRPGAIAIESTTLSYEWVRRLQSTLTAEGLRFIDSPVTGGRTGAEAGTLTLLVGATDEDLAYARPVMRAYSQKIIHFGLPGAATAYKLIVNLMVGVQAVALAESLLLAEKSGLNMAQVIEALTSGAAASPVVKAYAQRMVIGDHTETINFLARWMQKDMTYALELAAALGQAVPTATSAAQVFQTTQDKGWIDQNVTVVIEALRLDKNAK
jgi:3-hydroxyisobutyrate dehydrogenase